jgi:hypothetical protein
MSKVQIVIRGLCLSAIPLLVGFSDSARLNVKTGLWESTVVTHMSGAPPIPDDLLAKMTPEQRARMAASMAGGQPHTARYCLTQEKLDKGANFNDTKPNCKQTVVTNTSKVVEVTQECTDDNATTSIRMRYEAINPETVNGTIHVDITRQGKTMVSDGTMQGKWISADCGDVK